MFLEENDFRDVKFNCA